MIILDYEEGSKSNGKCPYNRKTEGVLRQRGEYKKGGKVTWESEIGVKQAQADKCLEIPEAEREKG